MNKVVIALLCILAVFSWYLSRIVKEKNAIREATVSEEAEINRLSDALEVEREKVEQLETDRGAAVREFKRIGNAEENLKDQLHESQDQVAELKKTLQRTQTELVRRTALNVQLEDRVEVSQNKLQELQRQLDEAKVEIERAHRAERQLREAKGLPRVRAVPPEAGP